jgi:hypothetical protein
MAKNPKDRYAGAREMRRAIRTAFIPADAVFGAGSYGELPPPVFKGAERVELTIPKPEATRLLGVAKEEVKATKLASRSLWRAVRPSWVLIVLALLGFASIWVLVGSR